MSEAIAVVSFAEFCQLESAGGQRHELVGGRVYAMAGGTERHDLAAGLFYEAVAPGARAAGCRPFTSNRLVRSAAGNGYYPDVVVVCGPAAHRLYEENPTLVAGLWWRAYGPGEVVETPYGVVDLDSFYDTVDRAATT